MTLNLLGSLYYKDSSREVVVQQRTEHLAALLFVSLLVQIVSLLSSLEQATQQQRPRTATTKAGKVHKLSRQLVIVQQGLRSRYLQAKSAASHRTAGP